jgi:hypothetical protein
VALTRPGTKLAAVLAALLGCCALLAASAGATQVPWGAGCEATVPRTSSSCGAELDDGIAVAPPNAPAKVKQVIAAANEIVHRPYVWGGGHASFFTRGYDCSGAVSYALHGADLLDTTMVSGQLAYWGQGGAGRWITVYANDEHVFMVVAGLRFDTRDDPLGVSGPRWKLAQPPAQILPKFAARHPAGL